MGEIIYIVHNNSTSNGFDWSTLITAITGLLGVIVGAFISYYFSKKINDFNSRSKIAIQRKNLLFSKLYKELIFIKKSLNNLQKNNFYFELITEVISTDQTDKYNETFYLDGQRYLKSEYKIWQEMKNDIRKTQIPKNLKESLENLESAVINYFSALKTFLNERRTLEQTEAAAMITLYLSKFPVHARNVRLNINFEYIFEKNIDSEKILNHNKNQFSLANDVIDEMRKIVGKVVDLDSRKLVIKRYDEFTTALDETVKILDIVIENIVNKYEYGNSL